MGEWHTCWATVLFAVYGFMWCVIRFGRLIRAVMRYEEADRGE